MSGAPAEAGKSASYPVIFSLARTSEKVHRPKSKTKKHTTSISRRGFFSSPEPRPKTPGSRMEALVASALVWPQVAAHVAAHGAAAAGGGALPVLRLRLDPAAVLDAFPALGARW